MAEARQLRIAASLWSTDPGLQRETLERAVAAGTDALHWDLADGTQGPAGGFTAERAAQLCAGVDVASEAHLMVHDARAHVDAWTDLCERIVVHVESEGWREALERIAARGCTPALALSTGTDPASLPEDCAHVLVMSVAPGTAGSGFLPQSPERARAVARAGARQSVGWDGSVDLAHAELARHAGVNWLVSGNGMLGHREGPSAWVAGVRAAWSAAIG